MIAIVLTSTVLSALISSGLTSWINWLIQRTNYRNEYYKKVLDKRIAAYEAISVAITHLDQFSTANGAKWHKFYDQGIISLGKYVLDIQHLYSQAMWLSKTLHDHLVDLHEILVSDFEGNTTQTPENLRLIGVQRFNEIMQLRLNLTNQLYSDLKTLHDVKEFIDTTAKTWQNLVVPTELTN